MANCIVLERIIFLTAHTHCRIFWQRNSERCEEHQVLMHEAQRVVPTKYNKTENRISTKSTRHCGWDEFSTCRTTGVRYSVGLSVYVVWSVGWPSTAFFSVGLVRFETLLLMDSRQRIVHSLQKLSYNAGLSQTFSMNSRFRCRYLICCFWVITLPSICNLDISNGLSNTKTLDPSTQASPLDPFPLISITLLSNAAPKSTETTHPLHLLSLSR